MLFTSGLSGSVRTKLSKQWTRGELIKLTPSCFVDSRRWNQAFPSEKLRGYAIAVGSYHHSVAITGRAAALIHGLPVANYDLSVHLLRVSPSTSKLPGVRILRAEQAVLARAESIIIDNDGKDLAVNITSIADSIAHMALLDSVEDAVVTADFCLNQRLLQRGELEGVLTSYHRRKNFSRILETIKLISSSTESVRETQLRLEMIKEGFTGFSVQPTIILTGSVRRIRPDFVFFDEMVIVEYDGASKYETSDPVYLKREIDRHHDLTNAGFLLVRIRNENFKDGTWRSLLRNALKRGRQFHQDRFWIEDAGEKF